MKVSNRASRTRRPSFPTRAQRNWCQLTKIQWASWTITLMQLWHHAFSSSRVRHGPYLCLMGSKQKLIYELTQRKKNNQLGKNVLFFLLFRDFDQWALSLLIFSLKWDMLSGRRMWKKQLATQRLDGKRGWVPNIPTRAFPSNLISPTEPLLDCSITLQLYHGPTCMDMMNILDCSTSEYRYKCSDNPISVNALIKLSS